MAKSKMWTVHFTIVVIAFLLLLLSALSFIQVPHTQVEKFTVKEPVTTKETYIINEPFQEKVPRVVEELVTKTEVAKLNPMSSYIERKPLTLQNEECFLTDYKYEVEYFGTLHDVNVYDAVTELGYKKNTIRLGVEICNKEKKNMYTDLKICNYVGDTLVDCPNRMITNIRANSCIKKALTWITSFDKDKHIKLEPGTVSQKVVCKTREQDEQGQPVYTTVNLVPQLREYRQYLESFERIKTLSGYLAIPKGGREARDATLRQDVHVTKNVRKKQNVTKFVDETVYKDVVYEKPVQKIQVVEKQREVILYRPLWQEIAAWLS
jgi:hypothetical protein